jgi:hypothetical protein
MSESREFSIHDDGYFGITFLDVGSYGAHLLENRVINTVDTSHLHFDDAKIHYYADKQAVSIEGDASSISTPKFAIQSLEAYAKIAREMDHLAQPFAS